MSATYVLDYLWLPLTRAPSNQYFLSIRRTCLAVSSNHRHLLRDQYFLFDPIWPLDHIMWIVLLLKSLQKRQLRLAIVLVAQELSSENYSAASPLVYLWISNAAVPADCERISDPYDLWASVSKHIQIVTQYNLFSIMPSLPKDLCTSYINSRTI